MAQLFLDVAHGKANVSSSSFVPATPQAHVANTSTIRRQMVDVTLASKETDLSPKQNILKQFRDPETVNNRKMAKRFKTCSGCPIQCVGEADGELKSAGRQGACILCGQKMNWYCAGGCRARLCHDVSQLSAEGPAYFRDTNTYSAKGGKKGHITGRMTCFMACHPWFLPLEADDSATHEG